jgi:hypothetical protein
MIKITPGKSEQVPVKWKWQTANAEVRIPVSASELRDMEPMLCGYNNYNSNIVFEDPDGRTITIGVRRP